MASRIHHPKRRLDVNVISRSSPTTVTLQSKATSTVPNITTLFPHFVSEAFVQQTNGMGTLQEMNAIPQAGSAPSINPKEISILQHQPAVEVNTCASADSSVDSSVSGTSGSIVRPVNRNPISRLQELCVKFGLALPTYTDVATMGPPHERLFIMKVAVGEFSTEHTAPTKKAAKTAAAAELLEVLLNQHINQPPVQLTVKSESPNHVSRQQQVVAVAPQSMPSTSNQIVTPRLVTNLLGKLDLSEGEEAATEDTEITQRLYSLCGKNCFSNPEYEEVRGTGPSHCPVFTIRVSIKSLNLTAEGVGKSKQAAKRVAAYRLLEKIRENLPHIASIAKASIIKHLPENLNHRIKYRIPEGKFEAPELVFELFRSLRNIPINDFESVVQTKASGEEGQYFDKLLRFCNRLQLYVKSHENKCINNEEGGAILHEAITLISYREIPITTTYGKSKNSSEEALEEAAFCAICCLYSMRHQV